MSRKYPMKILAEIDFQNEDAWGKFLDHMLGDEIKDGFKVYTVSLNDDGQRAIVDVKDFCRTWDEWCDETGNAELQLEYPDHLGYDARINREEFDRYVSELKQEQR